jgi:transcriptional regulator with XRE-family HTH domain
MYWNIKNLQLSRLREIVVGEGRTKRKMAKFLGISESQWTEWENGTRTPSLENIVSLCHKTGYSVDWILGLKKDEGSIYLVDKNIGRIYFAGMDFYAVPLDLAVDLHDPEIMGVVSALGEEGALDWKDKKLGFVKIKGSEYAPIAPDGSLALLDKEAELMPGKLAVEESGGLCRIYLLDEDEPKDGHYRVIAVTV